MKNEKRLVNIDLELKTIMNIDYSLTEDDKIKLIEDFLFYETPDYFKFLDNQTMSSYLFLKDLVEIFKKIKVNKDEFYKLSLILDDIEVNVSQILSDSRDLFIMLDTAKHSLHSRLFEKQERIYDLKIIIECSKNLWEEKVKINKIFSENNVREVFQTNDIELVKQVYSDKFNIENAEYDIDSDMFFFIAKRKPNLFVEGKWVKNINI